MTTVNFNTAYEISFSFTLDFFATSDTEADTIADSLIDQLFSTLSFNNIERISGAGSGVTLSGQDVSGKNYSYVYTFSLKVGDPPTFYHNILAVDANTALSQLKSTAARITGIANIPVKLTTLKAE